MMRSFHTIVILFIFILNSFGQTWNLRKDEEGVKVYTREFKGSGIEEFKGEVIAKANMATCLAVIDSVSSYSLWMHKVSHAERLKRISWKTGYIYSVIDAPWPLSDRDVITFYNLKQDSATKVITITLTGVENYIPQKPEIVRMPNMNGFWQLIPVSKGVTKIIYQVHSESGGSVPSAIVNAFITDTPYYNLLNLKTIVESPLFPRVTSERIREL